MSAPAPDGKPKTMEWTEDHDVLLLREILVSDKKKCCQGRMVGIARRNVK